LGGGGSSKKTWGKKLDTEGGRSQCLYTGRRRGHWGRKRTFDDSGNAKILKKSSLPTQKIKETFQTKYWGEKATKGRETKNVLVLNN